MRMYLLDKKQRVRRWLKDNDFVEAEMTEEINAANQINFSLPLKERVADNIYYVAIPTPRSKQRYLLFKLLSEQVKNDRIEYQGIEEAYDELKQYGYIKDIRPNERTAEEMLKMVLEPTRWSLGAVPETNHQSTNFYYISYLEALQKVVGLFNIELTFEVTIDPKSNKITRRQVNVYKQQGQRTGKRFEYGSNLLTVEQEQNSQELITALVGRGKGEQVSEGHDDTPDGYGRRITFADVVWSKKNGNPVDKPAGQEYLVDPEATELYGFSDGNPRIGLTVFEDIEDPIELINATWQALQSLKRPKVSFKADVTDVGSLGLGDTVAIIRHDLKIEYFTRVYKVKHNLLNENDNQIELGDDFSGHSITSSIIKVDGIANEAKEAAGHAAIAANGKNNNYYSSVQPLAPIEGDIWYKDLGNGETDMYQYHNGGWVFIQSTRDLHIVENQVKEAQAGLNQAKADIITNKQKADTDIENLNKSIAANKKTADNSLQRLSDSITKLQGQYDNNIVPDLTKVTNDVSDALQKYISAQNNIADLTKQAQQQGKNIADVTKTVDGLNINYANLLGDVNSTKVDVKGMQTTIGNASGDIAQLKLDAKNLQTLLAGKVDNATYTNFVNLTNQALNAKLTASDLNSYAKMADLQATANGLKFNIDSVTDRMNNLKIGTSNLLHDSDTFSSWYKGSSINISPTKYLNGSIAILKNTGSGVDSLNAVLDGPYDNQPVTWTIYAKADNAGDKLHTELWGGGGSADQTLTTDWQLCRFTGQRDARNHGFYLWGCQGNKGNVYIALPFAVVGNTIGTWSPNSNDIDHSLTELSGRITATSQQFSSYYTKSEADSRTNSAKNDAINSIKSDGNWQGLSNILTNSGFLQSADGFLQKVQQTTQPMIDANNGGGINLLKMSGFHNVTIEQLKPYWNIQDHIWINAKGGYTGTGSIVIDTRNLSGDDYRDITQWVMLEPNTDYRVALKFDFAAMASGKNFNAYTYLVEYDSTGKAVTPYKDNGRKLANSASRSMNSFIIHTSPTTSKGLLYIRSFAGTQIEFEEVKIERGRLETPWAPAPSDFTTQIAFAELSQTLEGLRSTVSGNYGQLQNAISQSNQATKDEITNKIAGVQNQLAASANGLNMRISNLSFGGGNLLHHSDTFEEWYRGNHTAILSDKYLNGSIIALGGAGINGGQINTYIDGPFDDQPVAWTVFARADNTGDKLHTELWGGGGSTNQPLTTDWQLYRFSGKRDLRNNSFYLWGVEGNRGNIYVALPMAYIGNLKRNWEPNPLDMATKNDFNELSSTIKGVQSTVSSNYGSLQTQLNQTASTLRGELTDRVNGVQNQITATANNFNVQIGSLTAGGENLLHNSDTFAGWYKGNGIWIASNKYLNGSVAILPPDGSGSNALNTNADTGPYNQNLTWTVYARADNNGDKLHTELWGGGGFTNQPLTTEWKKYKFTGKQNATNRGFYLWGCQGNRGNINVALPMLYSGSIDRDWSANYADNVSKNNLLAQINMSAGVTLIQNDKIYMDASSTVFSGNAFIPSAAITSLNADKITTGTLNAANVNIINLNANNITTGTINGQNLKINLNTGEILFKKGKITSTSGSLNIDIDNARMSVTNSFNSGFYFADGKLNLTSGWSSAYNDFTYGSIQLGDGNNMNFQGMALIGSQGLVLRTKDYDGGLYGLNVAKNGSAIDLTNGFNNNLTVQTANKLNLIGGSTYNPDLWDMQPSITIGSDNSSGGRGNRINIDADFVHMTSAYRHTTSAAPNLFIAADGALVRSTSASKYKTSIKRSHSTDYGERLLNIPTATWIDKGQKERYEAGKRHIKPNKYFGMIAEDLADAGLDLLVSRNVDGEIEGIQYERIAPALIPVIKKLKDKVEKLEEKLNEQSK